MGKIMILSTVTVGGSFCPLESESLVTLETWR
jgi:hypothetical protein